eukprot:g14929.t1
MEDPEAQPLVDAYHYQQSGGVMEDSEREESQGQQMELADGYQESHSSIEDNLPLLRTWWRLFAI